MTKIDIKIEGTEEFRRAIDRLSAEAQRRVALSVEKVAQDTRTEIVRNYASPGNGTMYYRIRGEKYMTIRAGSADGPPVAFVPGGGGKNLSLRHRASKPGEPPAKDTGRLGNSVFIRQISRSGFELGANARYAGWLEYGTRKIQKRPNWVPVTEKARERFGKIMRDTVEYVARRSRR